MKLSFGNLTTDLNIFNSGDQPNNQPLEINYIQERSEEEEEESDLSFEEIFDEELEFLEEADPVLENNETVLNICCFELNFEELFLDELRFLENNQQPNFQNFTEELVVRKQTFIN